VTAIFPARLLPFLSAGIFRARQIRKLYESQALAAIAIKKEFLEAESNRSFNLKRCVIFGTSL
jgi:hypothetical protein